MRGNDPRLRGLNNVVAKALRDMRHDVGLTQLQLARLSGMHREIVNRCEHGKHLVSLETIVMWAEACNRRPGLIMIAVDRQLGLIT